MLFSPSDVLLVTGLEIMKTLVFSLGIFDLPFNFLQSLSVLNINSLGFSFSLPKFVLQVGILVLILIDFILHLSKGRI